MKLGKKLLSLLTVLCLTLSLFPTMALADTPTVSTVVIGNRDGYGGGISLNQSTPYLASGASRAIDEVPTGGTGYIYFNTATNTVELHNYNDSSLSYYETRGICATSGDLNIKLFGDNYIKSSSNGIYSTGKLTISGSESGTNSLTLTPSTNGTTIYAADTITIQNGAKVTAPGGQSGQSIHMNNDNGNSEIVIKDKGTVVNAVNSSSKGIIRCGYTMTSGKYVGAIRLKKGAELNATEVQGTLYRDDNTQPVTTHSVSGKITCGEAVVADAIVQLNSTDTATNAAVINLVARTKANGTFNFASVPSGEYNVKVDKTGYTASLTSIQVGKSDLQDQNITLTPVSYGISVQGTPVTGANMNNVLGDAGAPTVTYKPETKTLTLNNATISSENTRGQGIYASDALTINLIGTNKITGSKNSIYSTQPLTITSENETKGSLTMSSAGDLTTVYATAPITIQGSAVVNATIDGNAQAINSDVRGGKITIKDTAQVTAKNIYAISDNKAKHSYAVLAGTDTDPNGTIEVEKNASLVAQGSTYALRCETFNYPTEKVKVSTNYSGANPVTYDTAKLATYKYVEVAPVEEYDVWVGDTLVTSQNKNNVLNNGKVTYAPDTQTLTLTDATITGAPNRQYTSNITDACGIYSKHDLTIKLIGDNNKVQGAAEQPDGNYGIFVDGRLTFTEGSSTSTTESETVPTPSITVSGGKSNNSGNAWVPGVYASGITVKNCNVTVSGGTATSDNYPAAYAMSKAPTLVGAKVAKVNTATSEPDTTVETYDPSHISRYKYLKIEQDANDKSVAAPVIAPEGGYVTSDPTVTITCPTSDAEIHYTIDGSEPTASSKKYENAFSIAPSDAPITVKAIAVKIVNGQQQQSALVEAKFTKREPGNEVTAVTLSLDARDRTLKVGDTSELTATVKHVNTTISDVNVTWASDNTDVATVENGKITAQSVGKARVTAAVVENGVTYSDFCDVIVEARPSSSHHSSSSTTYYDVNAAVSGEGGSVAAGTKRASRGTTVTVTATAASGYQVAQVSAVDKDGKTVSLTDKGDGVYTFVMPASKVDVTARFAQVQKPEEKDPYGDVSKDSYYYDAVKWAAETGVTTGVGDGLFAPEWVCTRGQIVTFLWRASGSPAPKATELPFTDVAADAYYAQAVLWAVENGITNGTSETTFSPDQTCTRAHAVAFLYRMSGSPAAAGSTFSDVAADAYYSTAVAWAVEKGITNGTSGTTFSPDDTCTRGQIVTFLYRLAQTK